MQTLKEYIKQFRVKADFCRANNISRQRLNLWINKGHKVEVIDGKKSVVSAKSGKVLLVIEG